MSRPKESPREQEAAAKRAWESFYAHNSDLAWQGDLLWVALHDLGYDVGEQVSLDKVCQTIEADPPGFVKKSANVNDRGKRKAVFDFAHRIVLQTKLQHFFEEHQDLISDSDSVKQALMRIGAQVPSLTPLDNLKAAAADEASMQRIIQSVQPALRSAFKRFLLRLVGQTRSGLPSALLDKLGTFQVQLDVSRDHDGKIVPPRPVDVGGAEKEVYRAKEKEEPVVVLYPKTWSRSFCSWNYAQERQVLESLQELPHENIIRLVRFIEPLSGEHGPCMVMECVIPVGFDLVVRANQYWIARKHGMPIAEVVHYLRQIVSGLIHLHAHSWVHCDLKANNVVVGGPGGGSLAKIIDFGLARRQSEAIGHRGAVYMPPEQQMSSTTPCKAEPSIDCWGLGFTLWQLVTTHPFPSLYSKTAGAWRTAQSWPVAMGVAPIRALPSRVQQAIKGLLNWTPQQRWTLGEFLASELMTQGEPSVSHSGGEGEKSEWLQSPTPVPAGHLVRKSRLQVPAEIFGVKVTPDSNLASKFIGPGPHAEGPSHPEVLHLARDQGVLLLFIERGKKIIGCPTAQDKLQLGDWLYFTRDQNVTPDQSLFDVTAEIYRMNSVSHSTERQTRKAASEITTFQFFPEFDEFHFPSNCIGAVLGPTQFAAPGQPALDLRARFGINLAGIWRLSETDEKHGRKLLFGRPHIGPGTTVQQGDIGFVCRWPNQSTGVSESVLPEDTMRELASAHLPKGEYSGNGSLNPEEGMVGFMVMSHSCLAVGPRKVVSWKVVDGLESDPIDVRLEVETATSAVSIDFGNKRVFPERGSGSLKTLEQDFFWRQPLQATLKGLRQKNRFEINALRGSEWLKGNIVTQGSEGFFEGFVNLPDNGGGLRETFFPALRQDQIREAATGAAITIQKNELLLEVPWDDPLKTTLCVNGENVLARHFARPTPRAARPDEHSAMPELLLRVDKSRETVTIPMGLAAFQHWLSSEAKLVSSKSEILRSSWAVQLGPHGEFAEHVVMVEKKPGNVVCLSIDGSVLVEAVAEDFKQVETTKGVSSEWSCEFRFVGEKIITFEIFEEDELGALSSKSLVSKRSKSIHKCSVNLPKLSDLREAIFFIDGQQAVDLGDRVTSGDSFESFDITPQELLSTYDILVPHKLSATPLQKRSSITALLGTRQPGCLDPFGCCTAASVVNRSDS
eukprot:CAMPEP_0170581200 /NCGR_PEP_ID=MMETSP0224-20130122/6913_1 /TAXON_ID=285029 /ORGANISM="Togula jolla, Strain CCCM 725" /LENGTH=1182 /DNA_ID=CAMNT_0010904321 /DNA_START=25 /DNA_END=3573 /DNA_ORIENTATION=-